MTGEVDLRGVGRCLGVGGRGDSCTIWSLCRCSSRAVRPELTRCLDRPTTFTGFTNKVSTTSLAVGTEYLALENVAARAGLVFSSDDRTFDQGLSGTYGTSAASVGVGLVPSGGILQMDAAYTITLHSGLDVDQSAFSLYARLLF